MAGLSSLEIAKRGLQAQQYALDITSNNIANANTEGYSRRSAVITETSPLISGGMSYGTGVLVEGVKTYRSELFDKEIRTTGSSLSGFEKDVEVYTKIEAVLSEPTESGIAETITEFFTAFDQLAMTPEDEAARLYTTEVAHNLSEHFNTVSAKLTELKNDINDEMNSQVLLANNLISDVAGLNKAIALADSKSGQDVQTYHDQRELKLEQLAEITDISVAMQSDGQANVYANGVCLISDSDYSDLKLKINIDPDTGEAAANIFAFDSVKERSTKIEPNAGKLVSYMKHFNTTLDRNESGTAALSVFKSVDKLASALAEKVNAIAVEGYGMDDAAPPERSIFEAAEGDEINADTIRVNSELKEDPRKLPISSKPVTSGNNDLALQIARLGQDTRFIGEQTANEFYSGFLGQFATHMNYAENNHNRLSLVSEQLANQRESIIGVNEDEEALSLVKFQRVYEACSRLVTTLNEMLQVTVNLGR